MLICWTIGCACGHTEQKYDSQVDDEMLGQDDLEVITTSSTSTTMTERQPVYEGVGVMLPGVSDEEESSVA